MNDLKEPQTEVQKAALSLAVLPLTNMSADPEFEYFSDGVSEDIIDAFTGISGLRTISRGSSFSLKNSKQEIQEIGNALDVQYVVSGTLRRIGKKVRMRVYLNATEDAKLLWSKSYDQPVIDIFDIQEDIILNLWNNIIPEDKKDLFVKPDFEPVTKNFEAYQHYLRGLYYHNTWTIQGLSKAIGSYQKAIRKEGSYFQAYSMMANAYTRLSFAGGYDKPLKSYEEAKQAADKAIAINPNYYRSYIASSYVYLYQKYDWEQALMMINKALKLHENSSKSHVAKSLYYTIKGNFAESRKLLKIALTLDPFSFMAKRAQADNYFLERKYEKAIELYDELLEIDPNHEKVLEYRGWSVVMLGNHDEAIQTFRDISRQLSLALKFYSQMGYAFAMKGDINNAEKYLQEIEKSAAIHKGLTYALDFAVIYTGMGDFEKAMDYLEEAVENKRSAIIFLKVNPIWDPMRKDPRFKALLKRLLLN